MSRFGNNNPVTFREKNLMSKKTKHATNFSMNLLNDFLQERSVNTDILSYSKEDLSRVLEDFYSNVRMKNGELYKKNSLLNIRQGIGRYLKEKGSNIDIITDPHFAKANSCFSSLLRMTRAEGKGAVVHHPALTVEDLKKLYGHHFIFNTNTPQGLLNKVVFEIMFYFCRRGQENLHNLRVQDFEIINSNEQKYVQKVTSELSKNHQGITNEIEGTGGRMYATNSELCPVQSFEKYLSKRHAGTDRLFLHSKNIFSDDEAVWYRNEPLGVNTMKKFMKNVSKSAGLSREYTNHCIRSTTITLLNHCGFESRHIATVSGHRNESSLSSYCYDTSDNQKKAMSNALSVCTGQAGPVDAPVNAVSESMGSHNFNDTMTDDELVNCTLTLEATHGVGVAQSYSGGRQPKFQFSGCNVTINNHYH